MNKQQKILAAALTIAAAATLVISLNSCVSIPKGAKAVRPFDKNKYLGKWYEIARMDFKYERGLHNVTATYSLKDEQTIRVDNKGFNPDKNLWKESIGKAKLAGNPDEGRLKVSFFGPFYAGYNVIAIDPDYKYALIVGNNLNYLWLLSREKTMPEAYRTKYLVMAKSLGYTIEKLVWTDHSAR